MPKEILASQSYGISRQQWEQAFLHCAKWPDTRSYRERRDPLLSCDDVMEIALKDATSEVRLSLEQLVDDGLPADEIVGEALGAFSIGKVGVEFPFSTHGDGITVEISRFPGGTAVGRSWDTSYGNSGIRFIIPRASLQQVKSAASSALSDIQNGADWSGDVDDFGWEELEKAWPNLKPSKKPIAKKAKTAALPRSSPKKRVAAKKRSSKTSSTVTRKRR